ncbi:hypothetical protein MP228_000976 [Amoeboaphelidium protococcarum]|nr:hypothetical protein MP228_000976 [Amoeboaphelidium protococcarum]
MSKIDLVKDVLLPSDGEGGVHQSAKDGASYQYLGLYHGNGPLETTTLGKSSGYSGRIYYQIPFDLKACGAGQHDVVVIAGTHSHNFGSGNATYISEFAECFAAKAPLPLKNVIWRFPGPLLLMAKWSISQQLLNDGLIRLGYSWAGGMQAQYILGPMPELLTPKFTLSTFCFGFRCTLIAAIGVQVLQAGHSLDCHFCRYYDLLCLNILTFREELQFNQHLRYLGRDNMADYKYAWIESGKTNARTASESKIKQSIARVGADPAIANPNLYQFLAQVVDAQINEKNDSYNRHDYLHKVEYRTSNVECTLIDPSSLELHPEYDRDWMKVETKSFLTKDSQCLIKFLSGHLEDQYDNDLVSILNDAQLGHMNALLTIHYNKVLFLDNLTFREELQFTLRLHYLDRDNMADYKYAWKSRQTLLPNRYGI